MIYFLLLFSSFYYLAFYENLRIFHQLDGFTYEIEGEDCGGYLHETYWLMKKMERDTYTPTPLFGRYWNVKVNKKPMPKGRVYAHFASSEVQELNLTCYPISLPEKMFSLFDSDTDIQNFHTVAERACWSKNLQLVGYTTYELNGKEEPAFLCGVWYGVNIRDVDSGKVDVWSDSPIGREVSIIGSFPSS
jgi:hypothetical protein